MTTLLYRRLDGSFVAEVNGLPYHIEVGSDFYADAAQIAENMGAALQYEPVPETPVSTVSDYENAIQAHVDYAARGKLFRDGVTLASYTASTNPQWSSEAQAFVAWRDAVWAYSYQELARVMAGEREQPTVDQILAELPLVSWP
ncbi:MAG: hypothetical protein ACK4P4_02875 [Allorhizobium sp.]